MNTRAPAKAKSRAKVLAVERVQRLLQEANLEREEFLTQMEVSNAPRRVAVDRVGESLVQAGIERDARLNKYKAWFDQLLMRAIDAIIGACREMLCVNGPVTTCEQRKDILAVIDDCVGLFDFVREREIMADAAGLESWFKNRVIAAKTRKAAELQAEIGRNTRWLRVCKWAREFRTALNSPSTWGQHLIGFIIGIALTVATGAVAWWMGLLKMGL